ncbi:redoxin domain-containing protein [Halobacillus andaensis]|uniref:redoxin domain-containing protein n=1 Tax=Halobacillus andaensis TaxID=1176239 RepID=UPI003D7041E4
MIKQIGAGLFLIILVGIIVYNEVGQEDEGSSDELQQYDTSGDTSQEGTSMSPPNSPAGIKKGEQAPDFELQNLEGDEVKLSSLRGEKVFLNFWATSVSSLQRGNA